MKSRYLILLITVISLSLNAQNQNRHISPFAIKNTIRQTHDRSVPDWRPGQERFSTWDSKGSVWNLVNTNDYSYDNSYLTTSMVNYESGMQLDERISYTYNASGAQESEIIETWNGSAYVNGSKSVTLYSATGFETGYENYDWDGTNWVLSDGQRRVDVYSGGNLVTATSEAYDNGIGSWGAYSDYTLTYNANNKIDEVVIRTAVSTPGVLENEFKFSCGYSASAIQPDTIFLYQWDGSTWILNQRAIDIVWNGEGLILIEIEPANYILQDFMNSDWINSERQTTTITGLNKLILVELSDGESWFDDNRTTIEYDQFDNLTIDKFETFDIDTWTIENFSSYTNTYDGESRLITIEAQYWNNINLALQNSYRREFLDFVDISGISDLNSSDFSLFPNPANAEIVLKGKFNHTSNYSVFDISGKCVLNGSLSGSDLNTINIQQLEAGYYLIRISGTEGLVTKSFVKN
ncbi:MAG TPA: T9SS type A sorting domain-containing protein [Flavobacteriales bacterium]|nr:T9SS type A sorting domain-containing protein [Flavobacteriales bacterium]